MDAIEKGRWGELSARGYMEMKGYEFRSANYRTRLGEVDLVMRKGDTIVFVEVKARGGESFGAPQTAVTTGKQRKIIRAALDYVKSFGLTKMCLRFDVVALGPAGVEHIENAFQCERKYTL